MWSRGTKLISETSPELGVGVVLDVDGRFIDVFFPDVDRHLRLSVSAAGIEPIELQEGDTVRLSDGTVTTIERIDGSTAELADGEQAELEELWPHLQRPTLVDHLAESRVDPLLDVLNRVDGQRILNTRQRTEIAHLVGGRMRLSAKLLETARRIVDRDPVRWILCGEEGSRRMSVACMVTAALLRQRRAERVVIVAPHRRAIRWLSDLYHRFHQLFVYVDQERWAQVKADHGFDANPFEVHPLAVVSSGLLASEQVLLEHLLDARTDLAVVDEPHETFEYVLGTLMLPLVGDAEHGLVLARPPAQVGEERFGRFADALGLSTADPQTVSGVSALSPEAQTQGWTFPDTTPAGVSPLAELPADFDETLRRFCLDAAERVELDVQRRRGRHVYYFEYGPQVKVEALPGMAEGARYLGTFDRRTALQDERLDFFSSGHPLVEGLLAELVASPRGRVGAVRLRRSDASGFHGLYLLLVQGDAGEWAIRLVPLMDATGAAAVVDSADRARDLYAALDMGIELEPDRVKTLMGRIAHHPLLEGLDVQTLSQAILVAVMDQEDAGVAG